MHEPPLVCNAWLATGAGARGTKAGSRSLPFVARVFIFGFSDCVLGLFADVATSKNTVPGAGQDMHTQLCCSPVIAWL
jgi:hypothetical protein